MLSDSSRLNILILLKLGNSMSKFNSYSLNYSPIGSNLFEALWKSDPKLPKLPQKNRSNNSSRRILYSSQNQEKQGNSTRVFKQEILLDLDSISWENSLNFGSVRRKLFMNSTYSTWRDILKVIIPLKKLFSSQTKDPNQKVKNRDLFHLIRLQTKLT